jgi:chaperone required for assembly of F1-ATPase
VIQPIVWQLNTYYSLIHPHDLPIPEVAGTATGSSALPERKVKDDVVSFLAFDGSAIYLAIRGRKA